MKLNQGLNPLRNRYYTLSAQALEAGMLPQEKRKMAELIGSLRHSSGLIQGPRARYYSESWPNDPWYQGELPEVRQSDALQPKEFELLPSWIQAINDSEKILDLEEDWDGEGGSAYERATWGRAVAFLKTSVRSIWLSKQVRLAIPYIEPGPNGSIDLHWRTGSRELLVNIPANPQHLAGYYGDELGKNSIKGKLDTTEYQEWIMLWLIK